MRYLFASLWLALTFTLPAAAPYGLAGRPAFSAYHAGTLPTNAAVVAGTWSTVEAFPNLTFLNPLGLLPLPGTTKLVVWEREGRIYSFQNDPNTSSKTLLLDLHNQCQGWDDEGLLGLAFHPNFAVNHYVYLWYNWVAPGTVVGDMNTRPPLFTSTHQRLARYTYDPVAGVLIRGSEYILIDQIDHCAWHNGGGLFFHPTTGFLYLTNGNDENSDNDQRIDQGFFGCLLRLDVDKQGGSVSHPPTKRAFEEVGPNWPTAYYVPNDNPFVGTPGALEEIYALGLRSPHRATVDPVTQRIFIGDVGEGSFEEIDTIEPGDPGGFNFQWSAIEGYHGDLVPPYLGVNRRPILDYPHGDDGSAVIGGYLYRGQEFPELAGKYVFGDCISGRVWYLDESTHTDSTPATKVLLGTMPQGPGPESGDGYTGLSSFGYDAQGELYLCQMSSVGGHIYKLSRNGPPARQIPLTLSATGVFTDLQALTPATGFLPYEVNTPLWSDGAHKQRWFAIPTGQTIGYAPTGEWTFPDGSVFVKHFELPIDDTDPTRTQRLETRVLVRDDTGYVYGGSYQWRADNSDADLVNDSTTQDIAIAQADGTTRTQPWFFPGRGDCLACHNHAGSGVLGLNTQQSHRNTLFAGTAVTDNQLRAWNHAGYFAPALDETTLPKLRKLSAIDDLTASLEDRARSYLDANCAHCHRPGGVPAFWDARIETPLASAGIIDGLVQNPLGLDHPRVIVPGDLADSVIHVRVGTATESYKMPPLAKNVVDTAGLSVLDQWIAAVTAPPPAPLPTPWKQIDLGGPSLAGDATASSPTAFALKASGVDIWDTQDSFHFVYRPLVGDGILIARVLAVGQTDPWAKAGVMIRAGLTPGAMNALTAITPANGAAFQHRPRAGVATEQTNDGTSTAPSWVSIRRSGNLLISATSPDGATWTELGRATIPMGRTVQAGLCLTSHHDSQLGAASFDNVYFAQGPPYLITGQPTPILARLGVPAGFDVGTTGNTPKALQWRRNGLPVPGGTRSHLSIIAATLANAGLYSALLDGHTLSQPAALSVIGDAPASTNFLAGATATLNLPCAGPGLGFQWLKNGAPLPLDPRLSGGTSSRLTVKAFAAGDEADYTCLVSTAQDQLVLGPYHLHLLQPPALIPPTILTGSVSGTYTLALSATESGLIAVTGLPTGLTFDPKTGLISGKPKISGSFPLTITVTNAAGTAPPQTITLTVTPFPTALVGTYAGLLDRGPLSANLGGRFTLTVTNAGTLTGRLYTGTASYPLLGALETAGLPGATGSFTIPRPPLAPYLLALAFDPTDATVTGTLTGSLGADPLAGRHAASPSFTAPLAGTYHIDLPAPMSSLLPAATSLRGVLTATGAATITGRLGDGTQVSFATPLRDDGTLALDSALYAGHGSILGTLQFSSPDGQTLSGNLDWTKSTLDFSLNLSGGRSAH